MAPSDFYCTQCGKKGLVCYRVVGQERKSGHLKKLFCIYCGKDQNCVEIKANSTKYSFEDFLNEFNNHNFDENGNRIYEYSEFKTRLNNEKYIEN